jgi:hypothetical protein
MLVTHKIDDLYVRCEDSNVYRLPHVKGGRAYRLKLVKKQAGYIYLQTKKIIFSDIKFIPVEPYHLPESLV